MKKRNLSDDIVETSGASPSEITRLLEKFSVNEFWEKSFSHRNIRDTTPILNYIEFLKDNGLDIGRGNCQFGYKMPLPEKDKSQRYLQIFRRR